MSQAKQYVKLVAKPNTWFKAGTEVWHCEEPRRLTLEEWGRWKEPSMAIVLVRGIRVCEDNPNENGMGHKAGDERIDGECCSCEEFDVEIVSEDKDFSELENK